MSMLCVCVCVCERERERNREGAEREATCRTSLYSDVRIQVLIIVSLQSPSNQSFYRQITGYGMNVGDHRVA